MSSTPFNTYRGPLKAVIFDWAGTTVDYGCFAPTGVFIEVFKQQWIDITMEEARGPMGMHKRDHISEITKLPRVAEAWSRRFGRELNPDDVEAMFRNFIPLQMSVIGQYSQVVPELHEALRVIRSYGLKIGSTTGYNNAMMDILSVAATRQGYTPDSVVCATDVPAGRPAPWMAFKNAENLGIYPMPAIVKIGDTIADIDEGLNAGMWSVGVVNSSNEMGLTREEFHALDSGELARRQTAVREKYLKAGAHYVIDTLEEVGTLIETINERMSNSSCGF